MTRDRAIEVLMSRGHDEIGANENINSLEECGMLETMTEEELVAWSINYWED